MSKAYIRDNGKVRMCASNVAKMNLFEVVYYSTSLKAFGGGLTEALRNLAASVGTILAIPFLPILIFWFAYKRRQRDRKLVKSERSATEVKHDN